MWRTGAVFGRVDSTGRGAARGSCVPWQRAWHHVELCHCSLNELCTCAEAGCSPSCTAHPTGSCHQTCLHECGGCLLECVLQHRGCLAQVVGVNECQRLMEDEEQHALGL